ncbi:MAG TPA: hypothetical protein VGQ39_18190 [Pyrinomonadaceae bacterium]|nr:hypothetical protein [Pyrinomonadaceae bacterium]
MSVILEQEGLYQPVLTRRSRRALWSTAGYPTDYIAQESSNQNSKRAARRQSDLFLTLEE